MTKERMLIGAMSLKMAYDGFAYLGEEKRQEIWDYADYLVAKGGYRLAAILNEIFK